MKWKEPDVIEKYEQKQVGRRDKTPMIDKLAGQLEDAQERITDLEGKLAECEREKDELREKLVELALKLAAHETAEDRKRILESEDVRSIMDLRLR